MQKCLKRDLPSGQKILMVSPAFLNPLWAHPNGKMHVLHLLMTKRTAKEEGEVLQVANLIGLHRSEFRRLVATPHSCILQHHELYPASSIFLPGPLLELECSKTIRGYKIDQFCIHLECILRKKLRMNQRIGIQT